MRDRPSNAKKNANNTNRPCSPDEQALAYLRRNGSTTVANLHSALRMRNPSLTDAGTVDLVWRMAEAGQVELEDTPPATRSLREYLGYWERNLGLYLALAASLVTVLLIYAFPVEFPLLAARWVLGSVFVLFIPGYVTVEALFPKGRDLDGIERVALSVGLSLALVPLIGLLLNYTPWGIRLDPIVTSLTMFTLALVMVAIARRFRLSIERFEQLVLEKGSSALT